MSAAVTGHSPEVRERLKKAGLSEQAELTPDQLARAQEADTGWSARKLAKFIMEGTTNGKKPEPKELTEEAKLAKRATEIAEKAGTKLGSPITTGQARTVMDYYEELVPGLLGASPKTKLVAYVEGGKISELPDEARALMRDFSKEHGDRRLWPRKIVALALAVKS